MKKQMLMVGMLLSFTGMKCIIERGMVGVVDFGYSMSDIGSHSARLGGYIKFKNSKTKEVTTLLVTYKPEYFKKGQILYKVNGKNKVYSKYIDILKDLHASVMYINKQRGNDQTYPIGVSDKNGINKDWFEAMYNYQPVLFDPIEHK